MPPTDNRQIRGVDLIKYIMAIGVVTIHVGAMYDGDSSYPDYIVWWMRSAVPFFFITTGYLLARDKAITSVDYLNRTKRTLRIFCSWLIVYLPISIAIYYQSGFSIISGVKAYIVGIFTYGQCPGAPLWYIYAIAGFMLTMYVIVKLKLNVFWAVTWFTIIYLLSYCISENVITGDNIILKWFYLLTRRSFGGGIYIMAGMALRYHHKLFANWPTAIASACISILLYTNNWAFWELLSGIAFFILSLQLRLSASGIWLSMRNESMWIYYTHMIPIFFIGQFMPHYDTRFCTVYLTATTSAVILAIVLDRLQMRIPILARLIR